MEVSDNDGDDEDDREGSETAEKGWDDLLIVNEDGEPLVMDIDIDSD